MGNLQPFYYLIDVSQNMTTESIEKVKNYVNTSMSTFLNHTILLENAFISMITFNSSLCTVTAFKRIYEFQLPPIKTEGQSSLDFALSLLSDRIILDLKVDDSKTNRFFKPYIILFTNEISSDKLDEKLNDHLKNNTNFYIVSMENSNRYNIKNIHERIFNIEGEDIAKLIINHYDYKFGEYIESTLGYYDYNPSLYPFYRYPMKK